MSNSPAGSWFRPVPAQTSVPPVPWMVLDRLAREIRFNLIPFNLEMLSGLISATAEHAESRALTRPGGQVNALLEG
jgi:hypothetical protein